MPLGKMTGWWQHLGMGEPEFARGASGGGCFVETGRHGRGMMDGSHASHCEKIIARCRQLRQCGGQPKPRENKEPGSPARRAPNLHIYMWRSRVNCSEFLRRVQSGGRCCFILHNKHTVSTHSSPFPRNMNQRCNRGLRSYKSETNLFIQNE